MSSPSDADAASLRDQVATLTARVAELEHEAEAQHALYLKTDTDHTAPELIGEPEGEVLGALEQENRDALNELKKTKSEKHQLKLRVEELEKELRGVAEMRPISITITPECVKCVERERTDAIAAVAAAEAQAKADVEKAALAVAQAQAQAQAQAEAAALEDAKTPPKTPTVGSPRRLVSKKPTSRDVRDAVDVLSAYARGDAASAMSTAALYVCMKHGDQCSNAESLLRRTVANMKSEARDSGIRNSGTGFGPGREFAGMLAAMTITKKRVSSENTRNGVPAKSIGADVHKKTDVSPRTSLAPPGSPSNSTLPFSAASPKDAKAGFKNPDSSRHARAEKASVAELTAPDARVLRWMEQKAKKEETRAKMKRRVVERDVKWMEKISKRQSDRLKQSRKQEEAEAQAMREELLKSRAKARESAEADGTSPDSPDSPGPGPAIEGNGASAPSAGDDRLFGDV